jgi:hypothetical protein
LIIETEEVPNPETPATFIAKKYQEMIDSDIKNIFVSIQKKALEEIRAEEDKVMEE